jgi:hypothetical protein
MSHVRNVLDDPWSLDSRPGPARRLPERQARAMVQAALLAMDAGLSASPDGAPAQAGPAPISARPGVPGVVLVPVPENQAVLQSSPGRLRGRRLVWLLAAAIVFGAAATSAGVYRWLDRRTPAEAPANPGRRSVKHAPAPELAPPVPVAAPVAADEPAAETEPAPVAPPAPEVAERPRPRPDRSERRAERRAAAPRTPERVAPVVPVTPNDMMKQANEQRRSRNWRAAETLYQRVMREHPGTGVAHVAAIAAAAIRLDHLGDARGALRLYRDALAGGRALAEEARWGVAESLRALGDTAGERRALEDFLARHPRSPLAPQATARLRALQAGAP